MTTLQEILNEFDNEITARLIWSDALPKDFPVKELREIMERNKSFLISACKKYAMSCVPEEMKEEEVNLYRADDPGYTEGWEFNQCRSKTLQNIEENFKKLV